MTLPFNTYRFGPFEVRSRTRELYKHGTKLRLRPQPFQVLSLLVERAGDVVTRDELQRLLWPAETFVDFEHGLNTSVKELRRALSDSAAAPRYIETLPKVGYRLIVPVAVETPVAAEAPALVDAPVAEGSAAVELQTAVPEAKVDERIPGGAKPRLARQWLALAAALVLAAALGGYWQWRHPRVPSQAATGRVMLAALPFGNLTGDSTQDYLTDGLTEELIAQLGRLEPERFGVIARTSVMHYKGSSARVDQIGRELGVQYVIEGSLRKDAGRVRVAAQLIRTQDETHVWAREYDRDFTSLLALQGEIASEIADEIQLALGRSKAGPSVNRPSLPVPRYDAYDLYLKGLFFWNKRTAEDFRTAIHYFEESIATDPRFARSYAGLADCYALLGGYTNDVRAEYTIQARAAALRALEIDPYLPEAHTALAVIVQNYDRDWQTSEREYQRAIELNPSYATAHHWYAEHLGYLGRFTEAIQESERARQLDPLSLIIAADRGVLLYYAR